jgi:enamine deaminase RidA (YjgF/YER057c/UK114 family)
MYSHVAPDASAKSGSSLANQSMSARKNAIFCLTLTPKAGEGVAEFCARLHRQFQAAQAVPLHLQVFGATAAYAEFQQSLRRTMGADESPITWVEGAGCDGTPVAGVHAYATTGHEVQRIRIQGKAVGSVVEDASMRHCLLGGLVPETVKATRPGQTAAVLEATERALGEAGFEMADIVRTWFFLDDLLDWYDAFNEVRTRCYSRMQFRTGSMPASTGVSGKNPAGAALTLAVWAAQCGNGMGRIEEVASPLQCPAPTYGSSFSRAMGISSEAGHYLTISGTASIALEGQTLWKDDVRRQIALTMEVVRAILTSHSYGLEDITRATAYFKHPGDIAAFQEWRMAHEARNLPVIHAACGICRDDLLFELEADAWKSRASGAAAI